MPVPLLRMLAGLLLLLFISACQSLPGHDQTPGATQPDTLTKQKVVTDTTSNTDSSAESVNSLVSTDPDSFPVFIRFFKQALASNNMHSVAAFVQFPFDEDGGSWTKEQFIRNFQLDKEERRALQKATPKKNGSYEYRLFGVESGLIFKKNKAGEWKWVSVHYAH